MELQNYFVYKTSSLGLISEKYPVVLIDLGSVTVEKMKSQLFNYSESRLNIS